MIAKQRGVIDLGALAAALWIVLFVWCGIGQQCADKSQDQKQQEQKR